MAVAQLPQQESKGLLGQRLITPTQELLDLLPRELVDIMLLQVSLGAATGGAIASGVAGGGGGASPGAASFRGGRLLDKAKEDSPRVCCCFRCCCLLLFLPSPLVEIVPAWGTGSSGRLLHCVLGVALRLSLH